MHPCDDNNMGCSHLCFLTPRGDSECDCPNGLTLHTDGKQCLDANGVTASPLTSAVPSCDYQCHSSNKCIFASQRCDGIADCPEHDDELRCNKKDSETAVILPVTKKSDNKILIIGVVIGVLVLVLIVVIVFIYRRRRSQSDLR